MVNTFINDELTITYTSNGGGAIFDYPIGNADTTLSQNVMISPGDIHTYTVTVEFIETGSNQNYNMGKKFGAVINIVSGDNTTLNTYREMETLMVNAAKTYVETENIVNDTYIPVTNLDVPVDNEQYVTTATGVEVEFEEQEPEYKPLITTYTEKIHMQQL